MQTIYKYDLKVDDCSIEMPVGAQILTVQIQDGVPRLWALVDTDAEMTTFNFRTYGTGHPCNDLKEDDPFSYIGTYQLHRGALVFHVFADQG